MQMRANNMTEDEWDRQQQTGAWPDDNRRPAGEARPYPLLSEADLMALPDPKWLIDYLITEKSLSVLYGPPGSGKSFIALSMAKSIQTGVDFLGYPVRHPCPVLYVAAEDIHGFRTRIRAWKQHHQAPPADHEIKFLGQSVILNEPSNLSRIVRAIEEVQAGFVILDTFARCTPGVDENSAKDMGKVVQVIDEIRSKTDVGVLLVHHSGKDIGRGARGSNALLGAVDTEIQCDDGRLKITKQKSATEEGPIWFQLEPVGDSVVPVSRRFDDAGDSAKRDVVLQALKDICPVGGSVPSSAWEEAAKDAGIGRSMYFSHRKVLIDRGLVVQHGSDGRPRFSPSDAVDGSG